MAMTVPSYNPTYGDKILNIRILNSLGLQVALGQTLFDESLHLVAIDVRQHGLVNPSKHPFRRLQHLYTTLHVHTYNFSFKQLLLREIYCTQLYKFNQKNCKKEKVLINNIWYSVVIFLFMVYVRIKGHLYSVVHLVFWYEYYCCIYSLPV